MIRPLALAAVLVLILRHKTSCGGHLRGTRCVGFRSSAHSIGEIVREIEWLRHIKGREVSLSCNIMPITQTSLAPSIPAAATLSNTLAEPLAPRQVSLLHKQLQNKLAKAERVFGKPRACPNQFMMFPSRRAPEGGDVWHRNAGIRFDRPVDGRIYPAVPNEAVKGTRQRGCTHRSVSPCRSNA